MGIVSSAKTFAIAICHRRSWVSIPDGDSFLREGPGHSMTSSTVGQFQSPMGIVSSAKSQSSYSARARSKFQSPMGIVSSAKSSSIGIMDTELEFQSPMGIVSSAKSKRVLRCLRRTGFNPRWG